MRSDSPESTDSIPLPQVARPKVLFICGTLHQTQMMHQIGRHLAEECECRYTPYYFDGPFLSWLATTGILDFTPSAGKLRQVSTNYLTSHDLIVDDGGARNDYGLVVTCSDLVVQGNIDGKPIVLVQEGLTTPKGLWYDVVRAVGFPRWFASTATFGLSDAYDVFCVASDGYRDFFVANGVRPEKVRVTGIPNFDNVASYRGNDFPHHDFVLVATSNVRENLKYENRRKYIRRAIAIAGGRPLVFKLHPGERHDRARREIRELAPAAIIYDHGNIHEMIANCSVLIAQWSNTAFTAQALGKEVHCFIDRDELVRLVPQQNGGRSGARIAGLCRRLLRGERGVDLPRTFDDF